LLDVPNTATALSLRPPTYFGLDASRPSPRSTGAQRVVTFGELAYAYLENHAKPKKRSWPEDERQLNAALLPKCRRR
jgi:hypothetical protein